MPPVATAKELGQRIKKIREAIRPELRQGALAKRVGLSAATVSGWETTGEGLQKVIDFLAVCRALHKTPNEVLGIERRAAEDAPRHDPEFEDMVMHAIEVMLTEYRLVNAADAHLLAEQIIRAAKAKQAAGVDKPSAVRQVAKFLAENLLAQKKERD